MTRGVRMLAAAAVVVGGLVVYVGSFFAARAWGHPILFTKDGAVPAYTIGWWPMRWLTAHRFAFSGRRGRGQEPAIFRSVNGYGDKLFLEIRGQVISLYALEPIQVDRWSDGDRGVIEWRSELDTNLTRDGRLVDFYDVRVERLSAAASDSPQR